MSLIDRILSRPELEDAPPVLVDIGASGGLHPAWRQIRQHSVCIAFDADKGGLKGLPKAATAYKWLHVCNLLVTPNGCGKPTSISRESTGSLSSSPSVTASALAILCLTS